MVTDIYSQYFRAACTYNGTERRAALVFLQADSEAGHIKYSANVTFFPFKDEDDYAVSYDAFASEVLYDGNGRRSKKKEAAYMEQLRGRVDELASRLGGTVFWREPLREARLA